MSSNKSGKKRARASRVRTAGMLALAVMATAGVDGASAYPRPGTSSREMRLKKVFSSNAMGGVWQISSDGRFVLLVAPDSARLAPRDENEGTDVFLYDRRTGRAEQISLATSGARPENVRIPGFDVGHSALSDQPHMTPDQRFVAFVSRAPNLDEQNPDVNNAADVFVRDRRTGRTERVTVNSVELPTEFQEGDSEAIHMGPRITPDGSIVAFSSTASNLAPNDANVSSDVFVRDRARGVTELISATPEGLPANGSSTTADVSADGRYVVFQSDATNLVEFDALSTDPLEMVEQIAEDPTEYGQQAVENFVRRQSGATPSRVYVRDRVLRKTQLVSVSTDGLARFAVAPSISANGRFVAFLSFGGPFVPSGPRGGVYVRDLVRGVTERVSVTNAGTATGGTASNAFRVPSRVTMSDSGRYVFFSGPAIPDEPYWDPRARNVFRHDRVTGVTQIMGLRPDGTIEQGYRGTSAADGRVYAVPESDKYDWNRFTGGLLFHDVGPPQGVGDLQARYTGTAVTLSGWATFPGVELFDRSDPGGASDGRMMNLPPPADAKAVGAELTGAQVVYRPEREDLLLRWPLAHLAPQRLRLPNTALQAGDARVLYRFKLTVGRIAYEVRARVVPSADSVTRLAPTIGLYTCGDAPSGAPTEQCTQVAALHGGVGDTGEEVRTAVPLSALRAAPGGTVSGLAAETASYTDSRGVVEIIDDVPDVRSGGVRLPSRVITLSIRSPRTPKRAPVVVTAALSPTSGSFTAKFTRWPQARGDYVVTARSCLASQCVTQTFPLEV